MITTIDNNHRKFLVQSQGFGSTGTRGEETEYLELINGSPLQNKTSPRHRLH